MNPYNYDEAYDEYGAPHVGGDSMGHTGNPTLDLEYERHRQALPEGVQNFLLYFQRVLNAQDVYEIESCYENGWNQLTERYYASEPWPDAESITHVVGNDAMFLILYKELYFRHIYARMSNGPTQDQRFKSYYNYCDLFNYILNADGPVVLELPNQWLWDIIDEFIYQFQAFTQYRCKLSKKPDNEIEVLRNNPKIWNIHSVLNVLHSLVDKSKINEQLEAYNQGKDQEAITNIAGVYGQCSLYKMLGYFSLIGLLRLHSLLGDYHQALSVLENINITKRSTVYSRVPECQITTYYYVGFAHMMMRQYQAAIDTFSSILTYIQRTKSTTLQRSSQYKMDMINKQTDQMFNLLALCSILYPVRIDESLAQTMREKTGLDKWQRLQKSDKSAFEECFSFGCPKFLSPVAPNFDAGPLNSHKEPMIHQCKVFLEEVEQHVQLPTIRSFLKLYSTMPVEKLAVFLGMDPDDFLAQLTCIKHKMMHARSDKDQEGQLEVDFYIDGDMVHIADTKIERGYADYFIKQIHKFEELNFHIKQLK